MIAQAHFDDLAVLDAQEIHSRLIELRAIALQRYRRFRRLVEECFSKWHQVPEYAEQLGCTEKSLTRAATISAGMSAKAFITSRINLAKRLLAHTDEPVALVAEKLGFEEATNFSKFFKRETGCTPAEFRRRQAAAGIHANDGVYSPDSIGQ